MKTPPWADSANPDRTHREVVSYERYGLAGHVERGVTTLMQSAKGSLTNCTPEVQAIGVFRDVIAALRACGIDPEGPWKAALAHRDHAAATDGKDKAS